MTRERKQRNMIIIALCLVLVLMGVGYAAYSTSLNINGTANISNSWCVGFDQTKTNTYTATPGLTGATTPTGTMTYTGTACETNYKPSVSLSTNFYQPGDQVEYTLTIKNKSSITAAIKSILVDSESVTSDTTITKNNIKYIINMPEATTLTSNGETTMTVTAQFQNDTPIDTGYTGETQTLTVAINTEQDDGNGGMIITVPKFTGTIYRWNANTLVIGDNINPTSFEGYAITNDGVYGHGPEDSYTTIEACQDDYTNKYHMTESSGYSCQAVTINKTGAGEYTTDASTLNKTYYLKHDVLEDEVTASYVCFVYNNAEHCMKGADNGASFAANTQTIQDYQTFYNLNTVSNPSSVNPGCHFYSSRSLCYGGGFDHVDAYSHGYVAVAGSASEYCIVSDNSSDCYK